MPRDGSGNYTLPSGNPVSSGQIIQSSWANTTLSDLGTEMTDSLSRSNKGAMLAELKLKASGHGLGFSGASDLGLRYVSTTAFDLTSGAGTAGARITQASSEAILQAAVGGVFRRLGHGFELLSLNADKTLTVGDAGQLQYMRALGTHTLTVNTALTWIAGTVIPIVNDGLSGNMTITLSAGTLTFIPSGATGARTLAPNGMALIVFCGSSFWFIVDLGGLT